MGSKVDLKNLRSKHRQLYLVVYGATDADQGQYYCGGGLDLGLNELGIDEARRLSRRFKKNPLKIKRIFSSPELRAIQMSDFLHDEMKGRIILLRELTDQILGECEGKPFTAEFGKSHFEKLKDPPKGENEESFSVRVRVGLEKILQEEELAVVVTHPRVAKQIFSWLGLPKEEIKRATMYAIDWPEGQGIAHFREV